MRITRFFGLFLTIGTLGLTPAFANEGEHVMHADHTNKTETIDVTLRPLPQTIVPNTSLALEMTLKTPDGKPLTDDQLAVVHTRKIHVLAIDPSFTDYHHLHPEPTKEPGVYTTTFTPKTKGPYHFFVETLRLPDHIAGLGEFVLEEDEIEHAPPVLKESTKTTINGLTFALSTMDGSKPRVGHTTHFTLSVKDATGQPVTQLEPIMGAFAHLVGFTTDGKSMIHMHPMGTEPTKDSERGGPSLGFMMTPTQSGPQPLFAQVQYKGQVITVPFVWEIAP